MIPNTIKHRNRILGINERNLVYITPYNSPEAQHIADDKVLTKEVLEKAEVPTTKILSLIKSAKQLERFDFDSLPKSFVVKPVSGVEGGGIEIIFNKDKTGTYICTNGKKMDEEALRNHLLNILEGRFSHNYLPDHVLIEERVQPHHKFRQYTFKGAPDVRILTFRNIPTMAMIRWPTKESEGKANASKGAVASGIDIATGITTHSLQEDKSGTMHLIEYVAGTHLRYSGFKIPYWERMLQHAVKAAKASGLGFCAADFLVDRNLGPLLVEMNARPGLRIQVANQDGLKWRLEQIKRIPVKSDLHAIRLGKDLFGGEIEEEIQAIAGKKLISLIQPIKVYHKDSKERVILKAKIDTGAGYSSIDSTIARELGFKNALNFYKKLELPSVFENKKEAIEAARKLEALLLEHDQDTGIVNAHVITSSTGITVRIAVNLQCKIDDKLFEIEANIRDRSQLEFPMILGSRALGGFLIDPTRK
ncbi:ATP-dependent zinc protease [Candidatus Woesebacteria bacterium]|nr:ATP-dependent zinc protease [Candidatus Woesebacteria bacterium]